MIAAPSKNSYLNPKILAMDILNHNIDLAELAAAKRADFMKAAPFPHIVFADFFNPSFLDVVLAEFPNLAAQKAVTKFDNHNEKKIATKGTATFSPAMRTLTDFLNSPLMLSFLQELTGIDEPLVADPHFEGGGYHEIKPGGLLKVHADFNKSRSTGLDRRLNLLVYLNKDWNERYGGHLELWNKYMTAAEQKILPTFNTVALFATTDFSYHGHPNALTCPPERSRKSVALYYFSNGRPQSEIDHTLKDHGTLFVGRKGVKQDVKVTLKSTIRNMMPSGLLRIIKNNKA
jgi:hypothetical protein